MSELEVGNCSIQTIVKMLEKGWKIKSLKYRGFKASSYGEPCWTTDHANPVVCLSTAWFEFQRNKDLPKRIGNKDSDVGFNHVIFEREE